MIKLIESVLPETAPEGLAEAIRLAEELGYGIYTYGGTFEDFGKLMIGKDRSMQDFTDQEIDLIVAHLQFVEKFERQQEETPETPADQSGMLAWLAERVTRLEQRIGTEADESELDGDYWYYVQKFKDLIPEFAQYDAVLSIDELGKKAYFARARKPIPWDIDADGLKKAQSSLCTLRKRYKDQPSEA